MINSPNFDEIVEPQIERNTLFHGLESLGYPPKSIQSLLNLLNEDKRMITCDAIQWSAIGHVLDKHLKIGENKQRYIALEGLMIVASYINSLRS